MSDFLSKISPYAPLTSEQKKGLHRALEKNFARFIVLEENRDGRGLKSSVKKNIDRTYKHFLTAINVGLNHQDPHIRREAKKLLKEPHHIDSHKLIERASRFCGLLKKHSRLFKERAKSKTTRKIQLTEVIELLEVKDATTLQSIGRKLSNCVKERDSARRYIEQVDDKEIELWEVRSLGNTIGLIQVDISEHNVREINEFNGVENEPLFLNPDDLFEIIHKLNINETDHTAFLKSGSLPIFRDLEIRNLVPEPVMIGSNCFYIWRTQDALAVASKPEGVDYLNPDTRTRFAWSYFTRSSPQPRRRRIRGPHPRRVRHNWTRPEPSAEPMWNEYTNNPLGFNELLGFFDNEDFYRAYRNIISPCDQNACTGGSRRLSSGKKSGCTLDV